MSKGSVAPTRDGAKVKLRIAAPPVNRKARAEAERRVAELLGAAASDVFVVGGASGRDKTALGRGVGAEEAYEISTAHPS